MANTKEMTHNHFKAGGQKLKKVNRYFCFKVLTFDIKFLVLTLNF